MHKIWPPSHVLNKSCSQALITKILLRNRNFRGVEIRVLHHPKRKVIMQNGGTAYRYKVYPDLEDLMHTASRTDLSRDGQFHFPAIETGEMIEQGLIPVILLLRQFKTIPKGNIQKVYPPFGDQSPANRFDLFQVHAKLFRGKTHTEQESFAATVSDPLDYFKE